MFLPFVFIIFSAQALAFHVNLPARRARPKNFVELTTPRPITDLQLLEGEWYGIYYWYSIADKSNRLSNFLGQCPKVQLAKATQEDIEKEKAVCQQISQVNFDFDKVEIIAQIANQRVLIAKGVEYHLTLNFCKYVGRIEFLKISDDVFLVSTPENGGMMSLIAKNVPSDEELSSILDNIASLTVGYNRFPYC